MKNRNNRLAIISEILTKEIIGNQEALAKKLAAKGYIVTQATLSRDLKKLKTVKVASDVGGYRYVIKANTEEQTQPGRPTLLSPMQSSLHPAVISMRRSGNILVIKTRNGYAGGLAYDLDQIDSPLILGTIAGADTVMVVVSENASSAKLVDVLSGYLTAETIENCCPEDVKGA